MSRARVVGAAIVVAALLPIGHAVADVSPGDDSIATAAGPLVAGQGVDGTFKSETDIDYVAFDVTQPWQTLHFDVTNTFQGCTAFADLDGCPIYATLIDLNGQQIGGEGSSAGTAPVAAGSTDVIDWTFAEPGRYVVAMDSDGYNQSYGLSYRVVPSAPSGTSATAGSPIRRSLPIASLQVTSPQRGTAVSARLQITRGLRKLTVRLERAGALRSAPPIAAERLQPVSSGHTTVRLRLDARARRELADRGRLMLSVRVVALPVGGRTQTLKRSVLVVRR